jgi:enoyl-CoA hydratase/carnithine racemase
MSSERSVAPSDEDAILRVARDGAVATISLDHPPLNLLTSSLIRHLATQVDALERDDGVRAVVVTAAEGLPFSGGIDPEEWARFGPKEAQDEIRRGQDALWALEHLTKPTVAAIAGTCRGAGLELALACDVRIAADTAQFSHPAVEGGSMPAFGGTARLLRVLGRSKAMEFLLTGKSLRAIDALRIGLVDHLSPPEALSDHARDLVRSVAMKPRAAVRAIKRTLVEGEEKPYRNRFVLEAQHASQLLHTEDYRTASRSKASKPPAGPPAEDP